MKIFIAVPTYENIYPDTFKSIYGLDPAGNWLVFDFIRGYDCAAARNQIGKQALNERADYVLMVDNDVVLPSDVLVNLLDDPKEVCLGLYPSRNINNSYDGQMTVYKTGEHDYVTKFSIDEIQAMNQNGICKFPVHGGGMGCALIRADVFERLEYPYFKWVNYDNGSVLSEDLYFCEQCAQNNIEIYSDTRVKCGHIFRHVQWPV